MLVIKIWPEFYHRGAANFQEITSPNITIDVSGSGVAIGFAGCRVSVTGVLSGIRHGRPSRYRTCNAARKMQLI
jgi:hypothetical protein